MAVIEIRDIASGGWMPDHEGYELPPNAFTDVRNIRVTNGYAERMTGHEQVFTDTAVVPYGLFPYSSATKNFIVHAGLAAVYVDDGTTRTDITGTAPTGAAADRWTGGTIAGILVLNNGVDQPQYWNGDTATNLANLTGWTSTERAYSMRVFKNYLVGMKITKNTTVYPHMVKWSAAANPGSLPASWDETDATVDAGEVDLAETPDMLVDGLALGDIFVLYKERSMYGMQYVGGDFIFRIFRLPGDVGMMARGCAAQTPLGHVVLTQSDVILHAGQGPKSIIDGRAKKWLFDNMNMSEAGKSFVVSNHKTNEVWVCFPEIAQTVCTKALVWNWVTDTLSQRDLPNLTHACVGVTAYADADTWTSVSGTWASITGTWSEIGLEAAPSQSKLFGCTSGSKIFVMDSTNSFAGSSFEAYVERTGLDLGEHRRKVVRGVWPRIDGPSGSTVQIQVGSSENPEESPSWSAAQTYTIGTSRKIDVMAAGSYISYRVKATGTDNWRLRSLALDVAPLGLY